MANKFTRPQGTEDVTPKQIYKWHTVEKIARETAEAFGYQEIRVPTFEQTALFQRSVGETTDVVQKEMYTVVARETEFTLRPEGTAGTIRAMLQNGMLNDALPQKAFYILSCFRHERPQAGRLREFHQFGLEMAGSASPAADAEIISLAKQVMDRVGLKGIALNINSIGCPTCRAGYHQALRAYFADREAELCDTCRTRLEKNPMRILDCKSPICSEIAKGAPVILDYLCQECSDHFTLLQSYLKNLYIDFTINPKIVRGLDYYTKTVFEFVTTEIGAQGTVCGGGRDDGLIEQLGGAPTPAMGFAMGLERLILTMEKQGCAFQEPTSCDLYLAPMDPESVAPAMQLAQSLREKGYRAKNYQIKTGLKAQMKFANKIGAKFVIVLGENERTTKEAKIKWMETGEQFSIHLDDRFPQEFENLAIQFLYQDVLAEFEEEQA